MFEKIFRFDLEYVITTIFFKHFLVPGFDRSFCVPARLNQFPFGEGQVDQGEA